MAAETDEVETEVSRFALGCFGGCACCGRVAPLTLGRFLLFTMAVGLNCSPRIPAPDLLNSASALGREDPELNSADASGNSVVDGTGAEVKKPISGADLGALLEFVE